MSEVMIGAIGFVLLILFMVLGLHVAVAIFAISLLGAITCLGLPATLELGTQFWGAGNSFVLTAIPMYVLLGELLVRSKFTDSMYDAVSEWVSFLPGGLLHTNIGASTVFASVSGSAVATAATISTMALPAFKNRRYDRRLVFGTIAAGATLGILLPPSINLIVYGALTGVSVGKLYLGSFVPGFLLAGLFMVIVAVLCLRYPEMAERCSTRLPLAERVKGLRHLFVPVLIVVVVMGSIYLGWATPTESAALGVTAVFVLSIVTRRLTWDVLHGSLMATVGVSAMIMLIMTSAFYMTFVLGIMGLPQALADYIVQIGASPAMLIFAMTVFYLVLGFFLEALPMIIGTIPIVFPLVQSAGIDPVWFGIFLIMMCCIALITPPVGMVLFVIQGIRGEGSITPVIYGAVPFVLGMYVFIVLMYFFPQIVLWLPSIGMAS